MAKKPLPTPDELRQLLRYEPETGRLFWRERLEQTGHDRHFNVRFAGRRAGYTRGDGYWMVSLYGRRCYCHRVIWAIAYGEWPASDLDHIDGNQSNNALCNLRMATRSENQRNRGSHQGSGSQFIGVYWHKAARKWAAEVRLPKTDEEARGRKLYLGLFDNETDAALAYDNVARVAHGPFGRLNFREDRTN